MHRIFDGLLSHRLPVTSKNKMTCRACKAITRAADPDRTDRFFCTTPGGSGDTTDRHGNIGITSRHRSFGHGYNCCLTDCSMCLQCRITHSKHLLLGVIAVSYKASVEPGRAARDFGTGSCNQPTGTRLRSRYHALLIYCKCRECLNYCSHVCRHHRHSVSLSLHYHYL